MDHQAIQTRLVLALKGQSRFSNVRTRVVASTAMTRESVDSVGIGAASLVTTASPGSMSLTDPSGNMYALTNITGFGQGATLR